MILELQSSFLQRPSNVWMEGGNIINIAVFNLYFHIPYAQNDFFCNEAN